MPLFRKCNNLREIRTEKGLSGYDLQILSSVPAQNIYLIERGLKHPAVHEKHLLSIALEVSEEEIFPDELKAFPKIIMTKRNCSDRLISVSKL